MLDAILYTISNFVWQWKNCDGHGLCTVCDLSPGGFIYGSISNWLNTDMVGWCEPIMHFAHLSLLTVTCIRKCCCMCSILEMSEQKAEVPHVIYYENTLLLPDPLKSWHHQYKPRTLSSACIGDVKTLTKNVTMARWATDETLQRTNAVSGNDPDVNGNSYLHLYHTWKIT